MHVEERNRENELFQIFRAKKSQLQDKEFDTKELLRIGIDQGTTIIVFKNQFRVTGRGQFYFFNSTLWGEDPKQWNYQTLKSGTTFDLKTRKVNKGT